MLGVRIICRSNFNNIRSDQIDTFETSDDGTKFSRTPATSLRGTGRRRNYGEGKSLAVGQSSVGRDALKPARASKSTGLKITKHTGHGLQ